MSTQQVGMQPVVDQTLSVYLKLDQHLQRSYYLLGMSKEALVQHYVHKLLQF
jgi:hypothetical protein